MGRGRGRGRVRPAGLFFVRAPHAHPPPARPPSSPAPSITFYLSLKVNLGVLEMRKGNVEAARANFAAAGRIADWLFEPFYNGALLAYRQGDFQDSFALLQRALAACPHHDDSLELQRVLVQFFRQL